MPPKGYRKPQAAKFMPLEDVQKLLLGPREAGAVRDYYLLATLFYLGVRVGECVQMRSEYFDLAHGCVQIPTLKKRARDAAGNRVAPLREVPVLDGKEVLAQIAAWGKGRPWIFVGGRCRSDETPRHLTTRTAENIFTRWCVGMGLDPAYTPHTLRHTACSLIAAQTKDPALVRDFARHSNISISNTYIHTLPERWDAARGSLRLDPDAKQ